MPKSKKKKGKPAAEEIAGDSSTGIKELDDVLGGGFPKGSVVLLSGASGSGKTIFAFQWLFEGVKKGENGLYITLTEPLFKSLKNLESMAFYDRAAVEEERLKIVDMRSIYEDHGFSPEKVLDFLEKQVEETNAKRLCIDSITGIAYSLDDKAKIRRFIFELGKILASLGCTSVLTSEVGDRKYSIYGVEEFISDGIVKLGRTKVGKQLQRKLTIVKIRGRAYSAEELYFKISPSGIDILPSLTTALSYPAASERASSGNEAMDDMLAGGVFRGSATLISGASGTGKSLFAMQFLLHGLKNGEPALYVSFDESRQQLIRNFRSLGWNVGEYHEKGLLSMFCAHPGDRFLEEYLKVILEAVEKEGVRRCAVDSVASLGYYFPAERFTAFLRALVEVLKERGVTTFLTSEPPETEAEEGAAHFAGSMDNIIMLRRVEIEGRLSNVLNVVKARGSAHSKELRRFEIVEGGIMIGQTLAGYEGIMTGVTRKVSQSVEERVQDEFRHYIGPMGVKAFDELSRRGLSEQAIARYADSLVAQGIMKPEVAGEFKDSVLGILKGERRKAVEEAPAGKKAEKGFLSRLLE